MNNVQERIAILRQSGWTLAAMADEVGVSWRTMKRWSVGETYPDTAKLVILVLNRLRGRRVPKKRRYAKGSRSKGS
jgi:lambda repressor-like predicted transcriptional regulator